MKINLFKQYNIKWLGTFINLLFCASPLIGMMVSIMESGTFYGVQKSNIHKLAPWMSFPIFLVAVIIIGFIVMYLFYIIVYPAYQAFVNRQAYIHNNPIQKDLAKILVTQDIIRKRLNISDDEIKEALDKFEKDNNQK